MSASAYRKSLRAAVYGLWSGRATYDDFVWSFSSAIDRHLTIAWYAGAAECGIRPEELSAEEKGELKRHILMNRMFIGGFGDAIADATKAQKKLLRPHLARLGVWVNRWEEVRTLAAAMACGDRKKQWALGATERHCKSCATFDGRVYRYSTWLANGALPQSRRLECGGWRCDCRLNDTDARITAGKFPSRALG